MPHRTPNSHAMTTKCPPISSHSQEQLEGDLVRANAIESGVKARAGQDRSASVLSRLTQASSWGPGLTLFPMTSLPVLPSVGV